MYKWGTEKAGLGEKRKIARQGQSKRRGCDIIELREYTKRVTKPKKEGREKEIE